jgi:hypothetical protein
VFVEGDAPTCAVCARRLERSGQRGWTVLAVYVLFAAGFGFLLSRKDMAGESLGGVYVALAVSVAFGVYLAAKGARAGRGALARLRKREPHEAPLADTPASSTPYRGRLALLAETVTPALSARTTAMVVGAALVTSAVLLPASLRLPRWMEAESVLASWWAFTFCLLSVLLYRGTRLREDHAFHVRWALPSLGSSSPARGRSERTGGSNWLDGASSGCSDPGCVDAEGCGGVLIGILIAGLALVAAWLVVELVLPVVFFLVYWLVLKAIARVVNDRHECAGDWMRATGWGAVWATTYTLPLALVVWTVHALLRARGHHP